MHNLNCLVVVRQNHQFHMAVQHRMPSSFGFKCPISALWSAFQPNCMLLFATAVHPTVALQFGLVHISAGDLLRAEVAAGTDAGKEAASYMDSGNLVPNSVVVEMVVHRLSQPDVQEHGWLLDGYPRSGDQAEAIVQEGIKPDLFVLISVCPSMQPISFTSLAAKIVLNLGRATPAQAYLPVACASGLHEDWPICFGQLGRYV